MVHLFLEVQHSFHQLFQQHVSTDESIISKLSRTQGDFLVFQRYVRASESDFTIVQDQDLYQLQASPPGDAVSVRIYHQ